MDERHASLALRKAAEGDRSAAARLASWLAEQGNLGATYGFDDLVEAVSEAATHSRAKHEPDAALRALAERLDAEPPTRLLASFDGASSAAVVEFGPAALGPSELMIERHGLAEVAKACGNLFQTVGIVVVITVPARGRLGTVHAVRWLRGALGAVYLLARRAGDRPSLGAVESDVATSSLLVGPATKAPKPLPGLFRTTRSSELNLDDLLSDAFAAPFLRDCLSPDPVDLVSERLTQSAPWFQIGSDALSYADAVLALGVALEAILGSNDPNVPVVETVSKRCGHLLREGDTPQERALSGLDWKTLASDYYGERSMVAHGRYAEDPKKLAAQPTNRIGFEDLVAAAALKFREAGKAAQWATEKEMKRWWQLKDMA